MKHRKRLLLAAAAVMLLSVTLLVGCGNDVVENAPNSIAGTTWRVVEVQYGKKSVTWEEFAEKQDIEGDQVYEFTEDGQMIETLNGKSRSIGYTYKDGHLTLEGLQGDLIVSGDTIEVASGEGKLILREKI